MKKIFLSALILLFGILALAEVKVVTTTTIIYDLVKEIGKEKIKVDYICRGDQDPHFLEIPTIGLIRKMQRLWLKIFTMHFPMNLQGMPNTLRKIWMITLQSWILR